MKFWHRLRSAIAPKGPPVYLVAAIASLRAGLKKKLSDFSQL